MNKLYLIAIVDYESGVKIQTHHENFLSNSLAVKPLKMPNFTFKKEASPWSAATCRRFGPR
jgi:hypothetical protein